jgi:hypothetical protein
MRTSSPHPHVLSRRSADESSTVVMVYAPIAKVGKWIEAELDGQDARVLTGQTVASVAASLIYDPAPRPQILVLDFDAVAPAEIVLLHSVRLEGWFGSIIGLGDVPMPLRVALRVEHVMTPPYEPGELRDLISRMRLQAQTTQLPVIRDRDRVRRPRGT